MARKTAAAEQVQDSEMEVMPPPNNGAIALKTVTPATDSYIDMLLPPESRARLFSGLPSHISPEVFERNLFNAVATNGWLKNYRPALVFREISKAAALGLLLDPILGECYLIEAYNGKTKQKEPQLRVGYRGMNKLARQSGNVAGLWCHEIHEKDFVKVNLGHPKEFRHEPKLFGDRGPIIGYAATISYKDGTFDFEPMALVDILKIRDRSDAWKVSAGGTKFPTPWATDEGEMCKKTVFRRLAKRQDLSSQMRLAIQIEDEAEFPHMVHQDRAPQLKAPRPPAEPAIEIEAETTAPTTEPQANDQPPAETKESMNPADTLQWITNRLAKVTDPFDLPDVWEAECLPKLEGAFPPDCEAANAVYDQNEKRLEPK